MAKPILECVPNISEGRNLKKIQEIADQVKHVEGVKLLDIDPGYDTNRTVITFAGEPQAVIEAAFLLIQKAAQLIDMRTHKGEHPRFGATDVCPLIPISGISMQQTAELAKELARRVGESLDIPVYLYENAAQEEKRKNLANCRAGEYEGLEKKLQDKAWKPDFGPDDFSKVSKWGATAISARDFLVAYNINLNTTSTRRANAIAFDVREAGRVQREGGTLTGKIVRDAQGNPQKIPGSLKYVKAIGWYIKEYEIAQISMNLTNIEHTPVHIAFHETCKKALERGIRVTGSELVGLIPLKALIQAADFYLEKQQRSLGISEKEKINIAVKSLGLDDLKPFNPKEKIIEYKLEEILEEKLVDLSIKEFAEQTASESPAPGGGSVSAYAACLGASLAAMVANLSAHKRGWDDRWKSFSDVAQKAQKLKNELLLSVDEDTQAFNEVLEAFKLPKNSEKEITLRKQAIERATKNAILIPYKVMETSFEVFELLKEMAQKGLQASVSDAGVGALNIRSAIYGAYLNVCINLDGLTDQSFDQDIRSKCADILKKTDQLEQEILTLVKEKIGA